MNFIKYFAALIICLTMNTATAQEGPDEEQLGAWYMYFVQKKFENSRFGLQGDYQFRYWILVATWSRFF